MTRAEEVTSVQAVKVINSMRVLLCDVDCHKHSSILYLFVLPTVITGRICFTWHMSMETGCISGEQTPKMLFC